MTPDQYLDWILDYTRAEYPGVTDSAIYEMWITEHGPTGGPTLLLANRLRLEIAHPAPGVHIERGGDPFLRSFEWRRLRMEFLEDRRATRRILCCECCGRSVAEGASLNVDHIKPRKAFPSLALDKKNLQLLCQDCNHGKGNKFETDWRAHDHSQRSL